MAEGYRAPDGRCEPGAGASGSCQEQEDGADRDGGAQEGGDEKLVCGVGQAQAEVRVAGRGAEDGEAGGWQEWRQQQQQPQAGTKDTTDCAEVPSHNGSATAVADPTKASHTAGASTQGGGESGTQLQAFNDREVKRWGATSAGASSEEAGEETSRDKEQQRRVCA